MGLKLIYANPEVDANLLYWGRIFTSDPFLAYEVEGKHYAVVSALEFEAFRAHSRFDEVFLPEMLGLSDAHRVIDCIAKIAERHSGETLLLPKNFPGKLLIEIQKALLPYEFEEGAFLPERQIKKEWEQYEIRRACTAIIEAFRAVKEILRQAVTVVERDLYFNSEPLTSEFLQKTIRDICFKHGALARETIVSCGKDSACPHMHGSGILKANEFIVVDIFPRLLDTGYYGDMTRTFLKGTPSAEQIKMYESVERAHDFSIDAVKEGVDVADIHQANVEFFGQQGYPTTSNAGFFHTTGHGVGLEIHEAPSVGPCHHNLRSGEVITIEPGLYEPEIGGVRIEDVVVVEEDGASLLSPFEYDWIL